MLADEAGSVRDHDVRQHSVFMNVAHEQTISICFGKRVCQIEAGSTVSRQVCVVANCLDVVINVGVDVLSTLFVVDTALNNVKQMGNHTARGETLAVVVKVEAPGIGKAAGKNFEDLSRRVVTPDTSVDELPICGFVVRITDLRLREDAVAAIQPAIRAPDKAVQCFVAIIDTPAV